MPLSAKYQSLEEYPFTRLNRLLGPVAPRANEAPIPMSVGEPQHEPPAFMAKTIADNAISGTATPPWPAPRRFGAPSLSG